VPSCKQLGHSLCLGDVSTTRPRPIHDKIHDETRQFEMNDDLEQSHEKFTDKTMHSRHLDTNVKR
jgi:hypothetical protein